MLDQLDLSQSLSKAAYERRLPDLEHRLYDLQHRTLEAGIPTILVFEGWAAAGKGSVINALARRLDPRGYRAVSMVGAETDDSVYAWMRRFWITLPSYGQVVVYDTSWYQRVLTDRLCGRISRRDWQIAYQDILDFEEQLAADGTLILKFWLHISKKEQARRFRKLLKSNLTEWRVSKDDTLQHRNYAQYVRVVEDVLARTDTAHAPWITVEATDRRFTRVKVFETLIRTFEMRLDASKPDLPPTPSIVSGGDTEAGKTEPVSSNGVSNKENRHA